VSFLSGKQGDGKRRTVPTAQAADVVRHPIQVVTVRGYLRTGILGRVRLRAGAVDAGRERRRHVVGEVQALQREVDVLFDLVGERAFEREALEVDEQHGRQSRKREHLGRFA